MSRADFRHCLSLPVRWGDMDALGHVNNVEYFRYLESGRIGYLETVQPPGLAQDQYMVLADIRCAFLRQLNYPATAEVLTRVERLGHRSLGFRALIAVAGSDEPAATAEGVLVWYDFARQRSAPLPEALRAAILDYEITPPAQRGPTS